MNKTLKRNLKRNKIQKLARYYKSLGYRVYAELPGYSPPNYYANIRPDLVVEKDDETILIEVKTRLSTERDKHDIEKLAEYAQRIPNTRFDLVLTNPINFKRLRDIIAEELIKAHSHYYIWKQLWPTKEFVQVINRYRVFFQFTRVAHLKMFLASIERITQSNKYSVTIWRLLDEIESDTKLAGRLSLNEIKDLRAKMDSYTDILKRIHIYQRRKIENVEQQGLLFEDRILKDKVITVGEAEKLLKDMGDVFNKVSAAYDGQVWSLKPFRIEDTTDLLRALSE